MVLSDEIEVKRMEAGLEEDFFAFRCEENGNDWCHCVAWWVPTWEGWGERTAGENRALRERLFREGQYDGYLLYAQGRVAGWCQCGPLDRLPKLVSQKGLSPSPGTWAVSCIEIAPGFRGHGLARKFLAAILRDLQARGAKHVQAFPKRGENLEPGEVWTGPEALFLSAGFRVEKEHATFPVYGLRLS